MVHFPLKKIIVLVGDGVCFYGALFAAIALRYFETPTTDVIAAHAIPFTVLLVVWVIIFYIADLYDFSLIRKRGTFYPRALFVIAGAFIISALMFYFVPLFSITPKTTLLLHTTIFSVFFFIWRNICIHAVIRITKKKTIFLGDEKRYVELLEKLRANPLIEYELAYRASEDISTADLSNALRERKIDALIIQDTMLPSMPFLFSSFLVVNRNIYTLGAFWEEQFQEVPQDIINEQRILQHINIGERRTYELLKRMLDIVAAFALLIIFGIIFFPTYVAVKLFFRQPIFYKQKRCTQRGNIFTLVKLRTMKRDAESGGPQWSTKGDQRVTKIGRFLRHTHIDELPQLWNIFRGELSFVGPRPERPEFVEQLEAVIPYYSLRHLIKPGITGWAQINFPYGASVDDARRKLSYDLYYIRHRSFILDVKILLKTVAFVFRGDGR